ncbi:PqqD family protein [Micromonospora wenchangensis]|uniref:PqqD family protein n=1 Tax=Micromonospora wenchangensis TaxID=1185415 RepID=A0A246REE9_9ACTN|nr:PqqD family protein [Micromonospora wenchangensis]OWV00245.1 hypothetical protein B5D80_28135 [Micromonospora wenchangensis]
MVWTIASHVVWLDQADEIQLYDTNAGKFQTLNATGAAIWRRLVDNGDQDAIVTGLAEQFGAEDDNQRDLIAQDTDRFLVRLAEQGLIVTNPTGGAAATVSGGIDSGAEPIAGPGAAC